jgi:hypothetical protein
VIVRARFIFLLCGALLATGCGLSEKRVVSGALTSTALLMIGLSRS